jgi:hypothetical protein
MDGPELTSVPAVGLHLSCGLATLKLSPCFLSCSDHVTHLGIRGPSDLCIILLVTPVSYEQDAGSMQ